MITFNKILVAKDFSECSRRALESGIQLARDSGAELHVLHVQILHEDPFIPNTGSDGVQRSERALADSMPDTAGIAVTQTVQRDISAAAAIVRYAELNECDVVVIGTHGRRGFRHAILGSVAEEVVRTAPCAVLTVHNGDETASLGKKVNNEILLPIDFSNHSAATIPVGRMMAESIGSRLRVLHVVEETMHPAFYTAGAYSIYDLRPDIEDRALSHLKDLYSRSDGPVVPVTFQVIVGHNVSEIVAAAFDHDAGMIVMSTHGLSGLAHFFMGSVAERVIRLATCPVLTLRLPASTKLAQDELPAELSKPEA